MKKFRLLALTLAVVMALSLGLTACKKTGETGDSTSTTQSTTTSTTDSTTTPSSTIDSTNQGGDTSATTPETKSAVAAYGTITFTPAYDYSDEYGTSWKAGKEVTIDQLVALEYLDFLIAKGLTYLETADRAPVYEEALLVLEYLNIEIPTYQRKNWTVYNEEVIDSNSLVWTATPYYGALAETWNIKLTDSFAAQDKALVLAESTYSEVFNPFFYSSVYDGDIAGYANIGLLATNEKGEVVAGNQWPSLAESYTTVYDPDTDVSTYTFYLKKGVKFSDGTDVTMEDVLFSLYTLLDPAYDGSSTLYSMDIQGLSAYRYQVSDFETKAKAAAPIVDAIYAAGEGYTAKATDSFTQAQYDYFWNYIYGNKESFPQNIVDYCVEKYGANPDYNGGNSQYSGATPLDFSVVGNQVAFGMAMWGFGKFDSDNVLNPEGNVGLISEEIGYKNLWTPTEDEEEASFADVDGVMYKRVTGSADPAYWISATDDDGYHVTAFNGDRYAKAFLDSFTDGIGKKYDMVTTFPTIADYWTCLVESYEGDYAAMFETEAATDADGIIMDSAKNATIAFIVSTGERIETISGITTASSEANNDDILIIKLNGQNPKAIYNFGFTVAQKSYYTDGFTYTDGSIRNGGVQLGRKADLSIDSSFMDHLKTRNNKPQGAGPYKFVQYVDNIVYLEANEYFYTVAGIYDSNEEAVAAYEAALATAEDKSTVKGIHNAYVQYINAKAISSGSELNSLLTDEVHSADVSAVPADVSKVNEGAGDYAKLEGVLIDNLGYGYICINGDVYSNLYERIAVKTLFDISAGVADYYGELAEVIYRSMSKTSWAYPEDAADLYPYDETCASAYAWFEKAGYTKNAAGELVNEKGEQFEITFYLPSDIADHPAGKIYQGAADRLTAMGAKAEIVVDQNLLSNIKTGTIPSYAIAWGSTVDPDMFQVYSIRSQADSPVSSGLMALYNKLKALRDAE